MKKIITVLLSVLLIAGLFTSCNGDTLAKMVGGGDAPTPAEYTVTFSSNGGDGSMEPQSFFEGEKKVLSKNTFTKYGYLFCGWSKTSDGETADYTDEESITITADIELYAIWTPEPFRFVAEEVTTINIESSIKTGALPLNEIRLQYKIDNGEWQDYEIKENPSYVSGDDGEYVGATISLAANQELFFKAGYTTDTDFKNPSFFVGEFFSEKCSGYRFVIGGGNVSAKGNIMYLLDETGKSLKVDDYAFTYLFENCAKLTSVPMLPATEVAKHCYRDMFYGCTALKTAPELPATTLAYRCYDNMFSGCSSLKTAPELPATTLDFQCYAKMFSGCSSLKTAPTLPATTLDVSCYDKMFSGCSSLETAPARLPAETLAEDCYNDMFSGCSSLKTAPELPALTLADSCYSGMFESCTALTTAPALPAETLAYNCYSGMFESCTALTTAPELPALALAERCYWGMFKNCTILTSVSVAFTDWNSSSSSTDGWLGGVSATGTFTCPTVLQSAGTMSGGSASTIPDGWTVMNPV